MKFFRLAPRHFLARALLPLMIGGLAVALSGCGAADDDGSSSKAAANKNGVTIKGDGLMINATASASTLPGFLRQPLSTRIMSGWVDEEKIRRANKETDPAEKKKLSLGSFGLLTLQLAAGKPEAGTYQLVPEGKDPESGTVIIDKSEDAGLADNYTSHSGMLTIKSVTMSENGKSVKAVEGSFDGEFKSDDGDSRAFSGNFRYVPKKK